MESGVNSSLHPNCHRQIVIRKRKSKHLLFKQSKNRKNEIEIEIRNKQLYF